MSINWDKPIQTTNGREVVVLPWTDGFAGKRIVAVRGENAMHVASDDGTTCCPHIRIQNVPERTVWWVNDYGPETGFTSAYSARQDADRGAVAGCRKNVLRITREGDRIVSVEIEKP